MGQITNNLPQSACGTKRTPPCLRPLPPSSQFGARKHRPTEISRNMDPAPFTPSLPTNPPGVRGTLLVLDRNPRVFRLPHAHWSARKFARHAAAQQTVYKEGGLLVSSQENGGSPAGSNAPRTPLMGATIRGLQQLGGLRGPGVRATSVSGRTRNDRLISPRSRTPSTSSVDRRMEDESSQVFDLIDQRSSRPLGPNKAVVFEDAVSKAGLDAVHREAALANSEAQGAFRHIVICVGQSQIMFDMSNLSAKIVNISNQVAGVLEQVEAALVKVESISMKVEGIIDHVTTLTELVQSGPNVQATPNAALGGNPPVPNGETWSVAPELRAAIITTAHRFITQPSLESYTSLETPEHEWLAHSLFNCIKTAVRQHAPVTHLLPPQVNGNVAKHIRERLHLLLLTGVYDPKNPVVHGAVPNLKTLVHRIAIKLGQAGDHVDYESVWAHTSELARCRIAYLRREAVRIFQIGRGSSSIWAAVDNQLHDLRRRGNEYTAAFYNIVYEDDCSAFDGQTRFETVSEVSDFRLPVEEEVNAAILVQANNVEAA
ncbi:uncharacterized protein MELLADRAFT_85281 [Melampsora larici-populina 98AG31]|uniref:Uncharacterized protein n=1 Tax=Melampsora larici-populina (strain 98AG31 / pathotype 3-4-7) TaxID=747676 RepID=F4RI76_MELLP|nr:uncharacterized protein MELLADRAFT_85281 [Melampsora larici-populina 98AG31]EGG07956.1 hypothetical protein MELLADRAFT_85281 [Melampsora larici-populina 98AG31]